MLFVFDPMKQLYVSFSYKRLHLSNLFVYASGSSGKISPSLEASMTKLLLRVALRVVMRMVTGLVVLMAKYRERKRERVLILLPHLNVLRRTLSLLIPGYLITPL